MAASDTTRTVLIADDDAVARVFLRAVVQDMGMRVVGEVEDGKQAYLQCQKCRPDLVCLDIEMPEMKGLEVLAKIRGDAPNTIVFLISAFATAQNVRGAMQLRADGIISKPLNKEKITTELQRAFARRALKK